MRRLFVRCVAFIIVVDIIVAFLVLGTRTDSVASGINRVVVVADTAIDD